VLLTGCAHREHPLSKSDAGWALRAEAASPLQHGRTQPVISSVIRRLNPLALHKRPQRFPAHSQLRARCAEDVRLLSFPLNLLPHRLLQPPQQLLHHGLVYITGFEAPPYRYHHIGPCQQVCCRCLSRPIRLNLVLDTLKHGVASTSGGAQPTDCCRCAAGARSSVPRNPSHSNAIKPFLRRLASIRSNVASGVLEVPVEASFERSKLRNEQGCVARPYRKWVWVRLSVWRDLLSRVEGVVVTPGNLATSIEKSRSPVIKVSRITLTGEG
jgi:hypothetical protein